MIHVKMLLMIYFSNDVFFCVENISMQHNLTNTVINITYINGTGR